MSANRHDTSTTEEDKTQRNDDKVLELSKMTSEEDIERKMSSEEPLQGANESLPISVVDFTASGTKNVDLDNESYELVPPDGGWGWMVVFGAFLCILLSCAMIPCFSILFFYIFVGFGTPSTTKGWIVSLHTFTWNITGPFTMPFVDEFGYRIVGFTGVVCTSLSLVISAYTPSAEFLFFSFSFLNGVGCGLAATVAFNIVPKYFVQLRGRSNAILMAGISMGQVLGPPFLGFLQETYSGKGAILIMSGLMLNGFVGISFFHPLSWHMKYVPINQKSSVNETVEQKESQANETLILDDNDAEKKVTLLKVKEGKTQKQQPASYVSSDYFTSSATITAMHASTASVAEIQPDISNGNEGKREKHYELPLLDSQERNACKPLAIVLRVMRSFVSNMKIMSSRRAIIINFGIALMLISHINFLMMLPFFFQVMDHTLQDASYAISILGLCSLTTRLIVSPLTDFKWFNMRVCFMTGYAVMSSMIAVLTFMKSLTVIYIVMAIYGCGVGANYSINNLVMIKYMGLEKLPSVFGASQLCIAIGFLCSGPFIGFIRDMTQSYVITLRILSLMILCSFLLWFLMPRAVAYDKKKEVNDIRRNNAKP